MNKNFPNIDEFYAMIKLIMIIMIIMINNKVNNDKVINNLKLSNILTI